MKTQAFLALVAGILAVHTAVLYFVVSGSSSGSEEEKKSPALDLPQTLPSSRDADPSAAGRTLSTAEGKNAAESGGATRQKLRSETGAETGAGSGRGAVPEIPEPQPVSDIPFIGDAGGYLPRPANFGKPLDYRYAVRGKIPALPQSASAATGILVDLNTRHVLWAKNPDTPHPIASMTKIMTLLLAYEDILSARGGITMDTPVKVSRAAALVNESQVYLDERETFTMRELMKATSIKSANDAAWLIAERLGGGDASRFVKRMNLYASALGMRHTRFFNPHGLPGKNAKSDNVSSPADMVILTEHTLLYPQLMEWASTRSADFRERGTKGHIVMRNHNNLLPGARNACEGVDGLKTGFTNRAGFCVTATCERSGRRLVAVLTGFRNLRERDAFAQSLIDWGYARAADPAAALKKDPYVPPRSASARGNAAKKKK